MNTIKKLSVLLALAFVAHEGSAHTHMTGAEIDALARINTAGAENLLTGIGTELATAFPGSTAQHQTLAVLTPLNISQADIQSTINPGGAMATDLGHFTQSNTASGSASAMNMGSTFTNSMSNHANTEVDQSTGANTTTVYEGTTTDTV